MIFETDRDVFFYADPHFGHDGIIEPTKRPWKNSVIMDRHLIRMYNEIVKENDYVFIIGDFSMKTSLHKHYIYQIAQKLNGIKILILGNHDSLNPFDYVEFGFHSVHTSLDIELMGYKFILNHDPAIHVMCENSILIHGHVHDLYKTMGNCVNVSVEMWDFKPVSIYEIVGLIEGGILNNGRKQDV